MTLTLYNTLTRQKELFTPLQEGKVDFYSCGPTVYNTVHIGNLRAFLAADTLYRWLKYGQQYAVRWVMNITDVDDKTIAGSQQRYPNLEAKEALLQFTKEYEALFFADMERLNIPQSCFYKNPRATESIDAMQDLICRIVSNGFGYAKEGSIYFSLEEYQKKHQYGKLVSIDPTALKTRTRTLADEIEKDNAQDFVLWKAQKEGEPSWDFDLNGQNYPGRPGWHIECSAMEYESFGQLPFDIHSGGVDLCFPHHEDEIAQSVAGYGKEPTPYWIHNEHLLVEGKKMSKSLGNFYTLQDLIDKRHSPDVIRFFLVTNHYRTKLNLSEEALRASHEALQKLRNFCRTLERPKDEQGEDTEKQQEFRAALHDDLNTPKALAVLFAAMQDNTIPADNQARLFLLAENTLGVRFFARGEDIPSQVKELAEERQEAKEKKDFATADMLRQSIDDLGFSVRDEAGGYVIVPHEL